jgi:hypothetical protein
MRDVFVNGARVLTLISQDENSVLVTLEDGRTATIPSSHPLYTEITDADVTQGAPEPARISVTSTQLRLALLKMGLLYQVQGAVDAGTPELKIMWEYATSFERDHPMIEAVATSLGKTPEDLDGLFQLALTL